MLGCCSSDQGGRGPRGTNLCEQGKAQGLELHCSSIENKLVIPEINIFSLTMALVVLGGDPLFILFYIFLKPEMPA